MQQEIERFLREKFNLQMKGNWQVFRFDYTEKRPEREKGDHSISWDSSSITTRRFCGKASC